MEDFKAKEADRDAQKKQLTSVVENLLRKVSGFLHTPVQAQLQMPHVHVRVCEKNSAKKSSYEGS